MEWYRREESDDFSVPSNSNNFNVYEDTSVEDMMPLQDDWCYWEVTQSKGGLQDGYHEVMSDVPSVAASTCGQPSLMDHTTMEKMDGIFCDSFLEDDQMFPDSMYRSVPFEDLLSNMGCDADNWLGSTRWGHSTSINSCSSPLFMDHELEDCGKAEDSAPFPVPEESERPEGPPEEDAASAANKISTVSGVDEPKCFEATVLLELEDVMLQLTENVRICFRDALYRLAKSSEQQYSTCQIKSVSCSDKPTSFQIIDESSRKGRSRTNAIDRMVANLMYNKACCGPPQLPYA